MNNGWRDYLKDALTYAINGKMVSRFNGGESYREFVISIYDNIGYDNHTASQAMEVKSVINQIDPTGKYYRYLANDLASYGRATDKSKWQPYSLSLPDKEVYSTLEGINRSNSFAKANTGLSPINISGVNGSLVLPSDMYWGYALALAPLIVAGFLARYLYNTVKHFGYVAVILTVSAGGFLAYQIINYMLDTFGVYNEQK